MPSPSFGVGMVNGSRNTEAPMAVGCEECGAPIPDGGTCIDHFHAMLLLESEVIADPEASAGGRGKAAHFYAVSSYILQHPVSMNYTAESLAGAQQNVSDHLAGRVGLAELLVKVRRATEGPARITRRAGDRVVSWPVESWPITVADVLAGGAEGYCERVATWAESIIRTLDAVDA
jgi:hypothetical protein